MPTDRQAFTDARNAFRDAVQTLSNTRRAEAWQLYDAKVAECDALAAELGQVLVERRLADERMATELRTARAECDKLEGRIVDLNGNLRSFRESNAREWAECDDAKKDRDATMLWLDEARAECDRLREALAELSAARAENARVWGLPVPRYPAVTSAAFVRWCAALDHMESALLAPKDAAQPAKDNER